MCILYSASPRTLLHCAIASRTSALTSVN